MRSNKLFCSNNQTEREDAMQSTTARLMLALLMGVCLALTGCEGDGGDGSSSGAPQPGPNTSIVGTFQSANYPDAASGKWIFNADGTFWSDFIEGQRSTSNGRYSYVGTTLTLIFDTSTNPNLQGTTEVHNNVVVNGDLYFNDRGAVFFRQ